MRSRLGLVLALLALGVVGAVILVERSPREERTASVRPPETSAEPGRAPAELADAAPPIAEPVAREAVEIEVGEASIARDHAATTARRRSDETVLVLRVLAENGDVIADRELGIELFWRFGHIDWSERTDSKGVLRIPLERERLGKVRLDQIRSVWVGRGEQSPWEGERIELEELITPGINDLGDVVMRLEPLLAAGVVQSSDGIPLSGAHVSATPVERADGEASRSGGARSVASDANGLFDVRGYAPDATDVQLVISHDTAVSTAVEVPVGASGLIITLMAGGTISGRVLLDPGVPMRALNAITIVPGEGALASGLMPFAPLASGEFLLTRLPPGEHELQVLVHGDDEPLLRLPGLIVESGVTLVPDAINPLDLRGRLRAVEVRVLDADGVPVEALVRHRPAAAGPGMWRFMTPHRPGRPAVIYTAAASIDVAAGVGGGESAEELDVTGDAVTLILKSNR